MTRSIATLIATLVLAGCQVRSDGAGQPAALGPSAHATFNLDGSVHRPRGYREWYHAGNRLKAAGINILDGHPIETPEILNAYIEPSALAVFRKSGRWPDGTQMVKEFTVVRAGRGCKTETHVCNTTLGSGIFEAGYIGLGMMVKDAKHFATKPGNWGFFDFGHHAPPYATAALPRPASSCLACHAGLASKTDYVVTEGHIGIADTSTGE